jgi:hypothetical protein
MPESRFTSQQAVEVAAACAAHEVDYLFIGKSGAILLGYPATTQDVDLFLPNREKDIVDLLLLEEFRREYERRHAHDLESAREKALRGSGAAKTRKGK